MTAMIVERITENPIIVPNMDPRMGSNINGPSLIRVPEWIRNPMGRYYLYFAHHKGTYIRLAYSDHIEGPWSIYEPGTLQLDQTCCTHHIASPDVHVDHGQRKIRMYFHGVCESGQKSFLALSEDGITFSAGSEILGNSYFRVFEWAGAFYAIGMPGIVYRSNDGLSGFEYLGSLPIPRIRHVAVALRDAMLYLFYSRIGDRPERILLSRIGLSSDVSRSQPTRPATVLSPQTVYEGADLPLTRSTSGWAQERVRQLRDPAFFREDGREYLLYSVAGEHGIAIARVIG